MARTGLSFAAVMAALVAASGCGLALGLGDVTFVGDAAAADAGHVALHDAHTGADARDTGAADVAARDTGRGDGDAKGDSAVNTEVTDAETGHGEDAEAGPGSGSGSGTGTGTGSGSGTGTGTGTGTSCQPGSSPCTTSAECVNMGVTCTPNVCVAGCCVVQEAPINAACSVNGGHVCNASGTCVACTSTNTSGCAAATPYCSPSATCVECLVTSQCAGLTPYCSTMNTCVQCTMSSQCSALMMCTNGTCGI